VDEPLVLPTGRKVRLLLTANDVIHSWWVPQLGIKQDAIPGFLRDAWFMVDKPGIYRGQCSELCGKDHGFMPIVVDARSPEDYARWRAARLKQAAASADDPARVWTLAALRERGEKVYGQNCLPCHQASGKGIPGNFPALDGSPVVNGDKAAHIRIVFHGSQRNPAMQAWGKQLSDTDIAAVITYERNAWGNHSGQLVQPAKRACVAAAAEEAVMDLASNTARGMSPAHKPHGLGRWLFATNHKDIGSLYLWFAFCMFLVGGVLACASAPSCSARPAILPAGTVQPADHPARADHGVRRHHAGLHRPGQLDAAADDRRAGHGLCPHEQLELLAAATGHDPAAAVLHRARRRGGGGWTLYAPLSVQLGMGMDLTIFAIHILGVSSIMGAINIVVTIINLRAPGMRMMNMPMFAWASLITAYLIIAVMPVLAGAVTMVLTDRHFGSHFFNAAGGGDPVLYQHVFWFFGHPEVYIMALPAFGIVSQVIPTFARKPLFGYSSMVYATSSIGVLSFMVWAHHMFVTGMPATAQLFFMYATMLIAVPTGVKVFNWIATMWQGSMSFETPMLFAIGFILLFTIGGLSGVTLSVAAVDVQLHGSYYVVAHFTMCWWLVPCSACFPPCITGFPR
jgi:cytochrome c oxidase subunit 1